MLVPIDVTTFADSDTKAKIAEHVRGSDLYIFADVRGGTVRVPIENGTGHIAQMRPDSYEVIVGTKTSETRFRREPVDVQFGHLVSVLGAARNAVDQGSITVFLPFFPSARQDRMTGRESKNLLYRVQILEALGADRIVTLDIHNASAMDSACRDIRYDNLKSAYTFLNHLKDDDTLQGKLLFVAPDTGKTATNLVKLFAEKLKGDYGVLTKERDMTNPGQVREGLGYLGDSREIKGATVVVCDDMIDSGGTNLQAMRYLRSKGAREVRFLAAHGVFSGPAIERFDKAFAEGDMQAVYVTNSVTHPMELHEKDWLRDVPVTRYFAKAITRLHFNKSLSELLEDPI